MSIRAPSLQPSTSPPVALPPVADGRPTTVPAGRAVPQVSGRRVAAGLLLFGAVWLLHLATVSLSPPTDSIEQLTWVRLLQWGYPKHPPLPTWLVWGPVQLLGLGSLATALLGASCTLAAAGLLWWLLVRLRGRAQATVALLAVGCISFYNGRLDYYNHNVVLLLLSVASAVCTWQAFRTGLWRWWLGLGLALGLAFLAKYQAALTVAALAVFALHQRAWRQPRQWRGLLLATGVALLVVAPHLAWLAGHGFAPLHYAQSSSLDAQLGPTSRILHTLRWLADQLFNRGLPAVLLLAWIAQPWRPAVPAVRPAPAAAVQADAAARALLLSWGLVPLAAMVLLGLASGANLQLHWGTPFLMFTVPAAMELMPRGRWAEADLRRALAGFIALQLVLLALSQLTSPAGWSPLKARHWRSFPSQALAQRVGEPARQVLGGPVRVVSGPAPIAGALALRLPEQPLVLVDGRPELSPWVPADLVARCGVLRIGPMATASTQAAGAATAAAGSAPGLQPLGDPFPGLGWQVQPPLPGQPPCPPVRREGPSGQEVADR